MSLFVRRCSVVVALSILAACGEVELSCEPDGDVTPLCGVQMPEDLEVMPNGGGLLIGEYGNGGQLPGAITWYSGDQRIHSFGGNVLCYGRSMMKPFYIKVFENWTVLGCKIIKKPLAFMPFIGFRLSEQI